MYAVHGLDPAPFAPLFDLDDAELARRGIRRQIVRSPKGTPCRVSLEDAAVGEEVLLLPYVHQDVDSPYRSSGAIFVRRTATAAFHAVDAPPPVFAGRQLSVRAYDANHMMRDAEVVAGEDAEAQFARFFADSKVAYLHVHYAKPGCFSCLVTRT